MPDTLEKDSWFHRVAVASHCTPMSGVGDPLRDYLRERTDELFLAWYPFSHTGDRVARLEHFAMGEAQKERTLRAPRFIPTLIRDFLANFFWFFQLPASNLFIGIDNVNATCGILLKWMGKTDRVIFYVIDYTRRRFRNPFLNWIYHRADAFAIRYSDEIWNISPRIAAVRSLEQNVDSRRNKVVPNGVDRTVIPEFDGNARSAHDFIVMASLFKEKGVQIAIRALSLVLSTVPEARLTVIGDGPYRRELEDLCAELQIEDFVTFTGRLERREMYRRLAAAGVGLAPYLDDPDSITYFADPGKTKEYLACGLPVITTEVPAIADDIRNKPMGLVVQADPHAVADAMVFLATHDSFYAECVTNAKDFVEPFEWGAIFRTALSEAASSSRMTDKSKK